MKTKENTCQNKVMRKLESHELNGIYGGFLWAVFIPLFIQASSSLIASIKVATADSGAIKVSPTGFDAKFENHEPVEPKVVSGAKATNTIVYAY